MEDNMDSQQGGKGSIWTGYGPYSGTGTRKVQTVGGPEWRKAIRDGSVLGTKQHYGVIEKPSAVKSAVYGLLKSIEMVYDMTPLDLTIVDYAWSGIELLRPAGTPTYPPAENMSQRVDHNTAIENQIWTKIHQMEDSTSVLKRKLVCYCKHENRLMQMISRSGLRAAIVPHPEYASSDLYLLLSGVDRDAFIMLLDAEKWLERVPIWHHLSPWAWKVKPVIH